MSASEAWTIQRLLDWTTGYLKNHGSESPRLEAQILLAFALHITKIELYTNFDLIPGEAELAAFRDLVKRRGQGEPVAYLIGHKEFYSLDFQVDSHVLVPRPETELLVLEVIEYLKKRSDYPNKTYEICDIGTGSGIIAITLAKKLNPVHLTAIDISKGALAVAVKNAETHNVSNKIVFLQGNLFSALPDITQSDSTQSDSATGSKDGIFDVIVSNPPYVSASEYAELPIMVKNYEPQEALLAGPLGTEIIERIVESAPPLLLPEGSIFMELSPMIANQVVQLMEQKDDWKDIRLIKDSARLERIVFAKKK